MKQSPSYYIIANGNLEVKQGDLENATSYFQQRLPYTFGNIYQMNNLGYFINLDNDNIPISIGFSSHLDSGWVEIPELKLASYQPGLYQFAQEITSDDNEDKFIVNRTTNGVAYSSAFGAQKGSTFEILESRKEDYLGMDAIKLHLRINCKLYNVDDDTDIIDLTETEVTISIVNEVI